MKPITSLYFMLVLLILFPVLDISGHFINLVEFYIYLAFFLNIRNYKKNKTVFIFVVYLVWFFCTILFTSFMAGKPINNHDIFVMRNGIQLVFLFYLIYSRMEEIKSSASSVELQQIMIKCFALLSIPALVVFLQKADLFHARHLVTVLYKPQFFFLSSDVFSSFRYTSVFKDFFTAAVYFTVLCSAIFYFYLKTTLQLKSKLLIILLLIVNYAAQAFVARTSLVVIPVVLLIMILFAADVTPLKVIRRLVVTGLILLPFYFAAEVFIFNTNLVKKEWVLEGLNIFKSDKEVAMAAMNTGSFHVMNQWYDAFLEQIEKKPMDLIVPHHEYDLTEQRDPGEYSDGFYVQEIYRYGIYGMIAYLYLVIFLLKDFITKSRGLFIVVMVFAFLNYKGGNVFFMPKNIYLYAFVFSALLVFDSHLIERKKAGMK